MIIFCDCNVVGKDYRWLEFSPNSNLSQALLELILKTIWSSCARYHCHPLGGLCTSPF